MQRIIPTRSLLAVGALLLFGPLLTATAQESQNSHVRLVQLYLAEQKYELPKGDYVLFAEQPQGIVSTIVVHDLTKGSTTFIPGHHSSLKQQTVPLTVDHAKLLRDVLALDAVRMLPGESGLVGLDGSAFVALIKIGERKQQIGHWHPNAIGIDLLTVFYKHGRQAYEQPALGGGPPRQ